jgi:hypothetical protein
MFSTAENLHHLTACEKVLGDGTFKIAPTLFDQLYTLHGRVHGEMMPLLYALLPARKEDTYDRLCSLIVNAAAAHGLVFNPKVIQVDFEQAAINSFHKTFPTASVHGCFFHYTQCLWKKIQHLGLQSRYEQDKNVECWVRRMMALPLVPLDVVDDVFMWAMADAPGVVEATAFHDYMCETWIDSGCRFHRSLWNHFTTSYDRTNNALEGWHFRMNRSTSSKHPAVFKVIELLRKEQRHVECRIAVLKAGAPAKNQKAAYRRSKEKFLRLRSDFVEGTRSLFDYVDAIKHIVSP